MIMSPFALNTLLRRQLNNLLQKSAKPPFYSSFRGGNDNPRKLFQFEIKIGKQKRPASEAKEQQHKDHEPENEKDSKVRREMHST